MHAMIRSTGLAAVLLLGATLVTPIHAGVPQAWNVNIQEIAGYTPLEIKLGYDDSGSTLRLGAAVLYNNGSQNVIDVYNFSADANGVTVDDTFSSVATGDVFALGELCLQNDVFIAPYIDNFDVRAIRWDGMQAWDVAVDTSLTNHTTSDCIDLGAGLAGITALDFDFGEIDYYASGDNGASWSVGASYSIGGDPIIGPFGGGFRPKSGAAPLPGGGTGLGLTYQLDSGPIHSVLLDPSDGSLAGGPIDWDTFSPHGGFIGNGYLKEIAGLPLPSTGYAFGAANGGTHIGLGWLDFNDGSTGFQLLNEVVTNELGFQGLALEYSMAPDTLFTHVLSNRHIRMGYDFNTGTMFYEEIPGYPFADIGGAVDAVHGGQRLYIGAAGLGTFRGTQTSFQIATMNTDPAVMEGVPMGGAPGGPDTGAQAIPVLGPAGLLALLALLLVLAFARLRSGG